MLLHFYRSVMGEREATRDIGKIIKIWKTKKYSSALKYSHIENVI